MMFVYIRGLQGKDAVKQSGCVNSAIINTFADAVKDELVRMDEKLYNYFVRHAGDKPYEFDLLSVNDQMAKVRDTTPTEIANKVHMSQIKFFKFCRKYFDCTATELIARVQGEE